MMRFLIVCVVLVSCRRRCGVITPHQHRCDVILTSHACWEDEQLLLCRIIAHAKSSLVHHRGLSAVGECKPADIQIECSIFVYRLNSFSFSEEYASVHCRNCSFHRISEKYAERILFFYNLSHPIPTLPYWSVLYARFVYFGKYFLTVEYGILRVNFSMDNSFKYTCLVFNTFVNINISYIIIQLIFLSGDLCCKHVLKVC